MKKNTISNKQILAILMTLILVFALSACGGDSSVTEPEKTPADSADKEEPVATVAVDSAILGHYEGTGYDVSGTRFDPAGEWLELNADGTGSMSLGPTDTPFDWTLDGDTLNIKTIQGLDYKATLDGEEIVLNTGMLYYFAKGGSAATEPEEAGSAPIGKEPAGRILFPSEWYGVAVVTNSKGFELEDGLHDVWGSFGIMSGGDAYFELYLGEEPQYISDPLVSMYVDEEEYNFLTPIIGEEDAWVGDVYLTEEDMYFFEIMYEDGVLDLEYTVDDGKDIYADCRFFIREYGTAWDEKVDPLPNGYAKYAEENYLSGEASTTASGDVPFTWGKEEFGKNGWVFTSTGSMKMQIPEGWEVQSSLSESSMGVHSAQEDGDVIMVEIEEYSSMIDDQTKRTPENQAKQNNEDATITKDRWGNTDVWYRVTEWTDYVAIAGYAAYDAEEYVNFDIRVKTINGTLEEFMESNAWSTLKTTFEIRTP